MRFVGVIGDPVAHSLSPHMHNAAFNARGIDASYELWQTAAEDLQSRIDGLRDASVLGANVTVPHKQAVMPLLDEVSEIARQIGAVNTIVKTPAGLFGDNTDAYGFRRSVDLIYPDQAVENAVVLGAGGAARAVIASLREMGVARIVLTNRTHGRAESLGAEFGAEVVPWEEVARRAFPQADLLVNATALGWHDEIPIDDSALDLLPDGGLVVDLTYRATPLLMAAAKRGLSTMDGLGMLVHQGARAFELWLGQSAPVEVMQEAVLAEQARRG